jgi:putative nucleotidyltransferase with HDIG domain
MSDATLTEGKSDWKLVRMQVLDRIESLPSRSTVVHEFLELSRRDFFTAKDFEKVLIKDQALVARLLKVANSALFGRSRKIQTIPEAVVLIGLENLKNIVYAVSSDGLMRRELRCYDYPAKGFWIHGVGVGMTARALSEVSRKGTLHSEEAYVGGLLHDVAKLIIDDFLETEPGPRPVTMEEERQAVGMDHTELAEHILRRWNIPEDISDAVRYHHEPCQEGEWHLGGAVVSLADAICNTWGIGKHESLNLGGEIDVEEHRRAMDALGLAEVALPPILLRIRQNLAELEGYYEDD